MDRNVAITKLKSAGVIILNDKIKQSDIVTAILTLSSAADVKLLSVEALSEYASEEEIEKDIAFLEKKASKHKDAASYIFMAEEFDQLVGSGSAWGVVYSPADADLNDVADALKASGFESDV